MQQLKLTNYYNTLDKKQKKCHNGFMTKQKPKNLFSSLKEKLTNLQNDQMFLICSLLCVIYLISGYWKWLEIGVSLCALAFMMFLPLQKSFCLFMFMHCFTLSKIGHDSCFMVTLIGFCLILLFKYWQGVKKGKYHYNKKIVIAISTFYAVTTLISLFQPFYRGAWLYFTYLPIAYFFFEMRNEFNIAQAMNYMFGGLITSCTLSLITLLFPGFQYNAIANGRFRAFINNTNYLHMRAVFILTYYMYRHLNNNLSNSKFVLIFLTCSIITFSTLSKTGMAMLAIMLLIYTIIYLKKDFKKKIKYVGIFLLILLGMCLIGYKLIILTIERFAQSFKSADFLNSLLTNRDTIWELYFEAIFSSPWKALFGHGLLTKQVFVASVFGPTETHNFYIFLLYRFGIIGTIALGYIIYLFIKALNTNKPKGIAYLSLIYVLLVSLCDNTMKCYNISYFIFAIMILFMECKDSKSIENTKTTKNISNVKKD